MKDRCVSIGLMDSITAGWKLTHFQAAIDLREVRLPRSRRYPLLEGEELCDSETKIESDCPHQLPVAELPEHRSRSVSHRIKSPPSSAFCPGILVGSYFAIYRKAGIKCLSPKVPITHTALARTAESRSRSEERRASSFVLARPDHLTCPFPAYPEGQTGQRLASLV